MKKLILLVLLAMTASAAQAAEIPQRVFKFDFRCTFKHDGGPEFSALATVFADVNTTWALGQHPLDGNYTNLIAVSVDDTLIAANSAILNSQERFVQIQDVNGAPSIVIRRDDHRAVGPQWMKHEAFLVLDNGRRVPGMCEVRSDLHDDHDWSARD